VRAFTFGSYNWQGGNSGDAQDGRLQRQLVLLADVRADAWVFQGCSSWRDSGSRTLFLADQIMGLRGFLAPSPRPGGDLAVFVREPVGLRVTAEEHEHGYPFWHAVAHLVVATPWPSTSFHLVSAHLAPTSPTIRLAEAEALAMIAKDGLVIAGGSWNALSAADPEPSFNGSLIDNLVASGYVTDSSSRRFEASYTEFNTGATKMIEGLTGMGQYLDAAARAFQETDTQLAAALK
jgi:hypothetical protein